MATDSAPGDTAGSGASSNQGLGGLILAHKRAAAAVVGIVLVLIVISVLPAVLGSSSGALNDATTCSEWAAASGDQKVAYAQLFLRENGSLTSAGLTSAAVQNTISQGCVRAAYLGEADDVSVIGAVNKAF
jgi:ABC-type transport system involved in cytochrome c biogenesis permease component